MKRLWLDARYGLRMLRKSPGFTLVALATLALGIGANTAIFSVVDAVLLHPVPYPDPGRIVALYRTDAQKHFYDGTFSRGLFAQIRGQLPAVENLSAFDVWSATITGPGKPIEVGCVASSAALFRLLGVHPVLGRPFTSAENRRGAPPVTLISATLWHKRFTANPAILGRSVDIAGEPYTIVGIFPSGLRLPGSAAPLDLWVPTVSDPQAKSFAAGGIDPQKVSYLSVLARLQRGMTLRQAGVQAATLAARLVKADPQDRQGMGLRVSLLEHEVAKNYRTALAVLLGAVSLLLLIACANVANLLLARATTREREIALRMALGAGRGAVVRQMLIESLELSFAGGALGGYLAWLAVTNLGHRIPTALTQFHAVTVNTPVLVFAAVVSLIAGIVFGALPALHASEGNVYAKLKEGGRGTTAGGGRRLREALVVVEIAMAVVLLAGAGLLLRSFSRLLSTNPGFEPQGVAVASVKLPRSDYQSASQWRVFVQSTLHRLHGQPGVLQTAAAVTPPMGSIKISLSYTVTGQPTPPAGQTPQADLRPVTPGYFTLMRIPLLAGRDFTASDSAASAPVCVINQALVRVSFAAADPVGRSITVGFLKNPCRVVGVVGDVRLQLDETPDPAIYVPFDQVPFWDASFLARGKQGTAALIPLLRDSIRSVDRQLPVDSATLSSQVDLSVARERFRTTLVGLFAALAILLAAVGISGVMGYSVSRRTQEIGLRMALGATPREVLGQVVREGLRLSLIGGALGIVAALALSRFLRSLLYGVGPADTVTYAGVALLLALVSILACGVPALRAARVEPTVALRYE